MQHRALLWVPLALCVFGLALTLTTVQSYAFPARTQPITSKEDHSTDLCQERIVNGGFETTGGWILPTTAQRAAYGTEQVHGGDQSLRAGITAAEANIFSYSSAIQNVQIPTATVTATLTLWWYPLSGEGELPANVAAAEAIAAPNIGGTTGDRQYVLILDANDQILARPLSTRSDRQTWQQLVFDLSPYAGKTIRVYAGVYNDGTGGRTAMFVDDVSLVTCAATAAAGYLPIVKQATNTPTPMPTATATPTSTPTVVWTDPGQAIEVFSPVTRTLYHSPIQVRGFSQTFEGVVNIRLVDQHAQVLAERTAQGGSVDGFAFFDSYVRFTLSNQISATLEVFEVSAADGAEINKVQIPVVLAPGQPVVDLNSPTAGATVCNPIWVKGYSNTFEAVANVALSARNGAELVRTTATGGNLGVYADFTAPISHTISTAQPLLVGAFEESAAGFGPVDYTRTPITLQPTGAGGCP